MRTRPSDHQKVLVNEAGARSIAAMYNAIRESERPLTAEEATTRLARLAAHRQDTLDSTASAIADGVQVSHLILTAPHSCEAAHSQLGRRYSSDALPYLPLNNCSVSPKCPCCFTSEATNIDEIDARFEAELSKLPVAKADAARNILITAFGGSPVDFAAERETATREGHLIERKNANEEVSGRHSWIARARRALLGKSC